jgi:hypothetical protein
MVGMRAAGGDVLNAALSLSAEQWQQPSAATGWSVKDVFVHIGSLLELLQAAVRGATAPNISVEALNDSIVAERRQWTVSETVRFLRDQIGSAIDTFAALQHEPIASTLAPMLDLGSYPVHAIADMFTFDMTTHLRFDVLAPRGPATVPVLPLDDMRLGPAVTWLIGGLSQMQPELATHVTAPIGLRLDGPGGRHVGVRSDGTKLTGEDSASADSAAAEIVSTEAFLAWSTKRLPWTGLVRIDGAEQVATEFLDAINLI